MQAVLLFKILIILTLTSNVSCLLEETTCPKVRII